MAMTIILSEIYTNKSTFAFNGWNILSMKKQIRKI